MPTTVFQGIASELPSISLLDDTVKRSAIRTDGAARRLQYVTPEMPPVVRLTITHSTAGADL